MGLKSSIGMKVLAIGLPSLILLLTAGGLVTAAVINNGKQANTSSSASSPNTEEKKSHSVTVGTLEHGDVEVPVEKVKEGESFSITLLPDTGYSVKSYTIDGVIHEATEAKKGEPYKVDGIVQKDGGSTIGATFVANEYKITLKGGDRSVTFDPETIKVTYDQPIEGLPTTHDGVPHYTIVEWKNADSNVYKNGDTWNVAKDVELQATWNPNSYTMTLNANGGVFSDGSSSKTETVSYEQRWNFEEPTKDGNLFKGWYVGGNKVESSGISWTKYTENKTLTAQWTSISGLQKGDKLNFGEYPQTDVTDILGTILNALVKADGWTSYDYYASGAISDLMKYQDVESIGGKYRGVYFTSYRPNQTSLESSADNSNQDDNGYNPNNIYWFKWEPITWTVLENSSGEPYLLTEKILDSQQYYRTADTTQKTRAPYDSKETSSVYDNNYQYSDIRGWLNTTFYDWSFSDSDKNHINTTEVDNSASTTMDSDNVYASDTTNDKVFLPSYQDCFGTSGYFSDDESRKAKATDYAKAQGVYIPDNPSDDDFYTTYWWSRSPRSLFSISYFASLVHNNGNSYHTNVFYTNRGVRSALKIK